MQSRKENTVLVWDPTGFFTHKDPLASICRSFSCREVHHQSLVHLRNGCHRRSRRSTQCRSEHRSKDRKLPARKKGIQGTAKHLAHLTENIEEVDRLVRKFPGALPDDVCDLFNGALQRARSSLFDFDEAVENDFSKAFAAKNSGLVEHLKSTGYRVFRANSLNCKMNTVEAQLNDASNKLMHLIAIMAIALKIDSRTLLESKSDEYSPSFCAPAVSHTIKLDFRTRDAHGKFVTPEGALKHKVLSSVSSKSVTYATGVLNPAHGVLGMAGVGKTIALQGLTSDQDVRTRFSRWDPVLEPGSGS